MNLDPEKLLVLFVIALLVLGPQRLPQVARTVGRALAEVRKFTSPFQSEIRQVFAEPQSELRQAFAEPRAMVETAVHEAQMISASPDPAVADGNAAEATWASPTPPMPDDPALN
ncbi:MAG TPA: twin-arginine translocase TatA/TatE family subunit [Acidimicrobiales bacterium]|nr:twin-arginine translocase TatA/TatE family subunit [Acidimicrobiales bacterium]